MSSFDSDAPDPKLIAELRAELAPVDAAARERVANRLLQSLGAGTLSADDLGGESRATSAAAKPVWSTLRPATGFIASFALGAACGAGTYALWRPAPRIEIRYVTMPALSSSARAPSPPSAPLLDNAAEVEPAGAAAPASTLVTHSRRSAGLAEQQALLDVARAAFTRGDSAATLRTLREHWRRFPQSLLGEERAALEIKALAAAGRRVEAGAKAARFKSQFPQSLLLPSVNDSAAQNP